MEQNKLKLEDCCLTIEQAKELMELGVDMNNTQMIILQDNRIVPTHISEIDEFFDFCRYDTPTLTNTEMLEMLPNSIESVMLEIHYWNGWNIRYYGILEVQDGLLRNVLFEVIKYLKTNKLI